MVATDEDASSSTRSFFKKKNKKKCHFFLHPVIYGNFLYLKKRTVTCFVTSEIIILRFLQSRYKVSSWFQNFLEFLNLFLEGVLED